MEINRKNVMESIKSYNATPDKDFGQNFLVEPSISKRIVESLCITDGEKVLEVGPGIGSLTHFLVESKQDITVVDVDERMTFFLEVIYQNASNLDIVLSDIRRFDVSNYDKIIGNLPYNITTELVTYLVMNAKHAKKLVLMCQLEAFNRFHALSGKDYGPISILIHLLGGSKKVLNVPKGMFYPVPKVDSLVFEVNITRENKEEAYGVYKMAKQLFLNRRKTLLNNMINYLKNKEKAEWVLNELNIPLNKRGEEISPEMFLKIYQLLKKD